VCCHSNTFLCVQPARGRTATTNPKGGGRRQQPERQAQDSQPVRVWPGETPGSPVARLPASGEIPPSKRSNKVPARGRATGPVCSGSEARASVVSCDPPKGGPRESRACGKGAKATESTPGPGAGAQELSGVRGVERPEGCPGNWRGPPRPRGGRWRPAQSRPIRHATATCPRRVTGGPCVARSSGRAEDHRPTAAEREAKPAHNRQNREREGPAERESEGVVVVTTGGQQNPLRVKGPYFIGARS